MNSSEIAKIAGVSRSTVSRVINNYPNVPEETKEKVLKVISEYDYVPHASARMLAGGKNKVIGLFIIDIVPGKKDIKNRITKSPYYLELTSSVIEYASEREYNILVQIVHSSEGYNQIKECFYNKTISGGIFIGENNDDPIIKKIINDGYKVALIDQDMRLEDDAYSKCIIVNADNFSGAYNATNYLINSNHRKIAHITGDIGKFSAIERVKGYKKALEDANLSIENEFIVNSTFIEEGGYNSTKKLLLQDNKPTAIFASNDKIAIGAMRAIKEVGLKVPDDISIIGFDDIEECKYLNPQLTTIKMDLDKMAELVTDLIITSIEKDETIATYHTVPVGLVERESCLELNDKNQL